MKKKVKKNKPKVQSLKKQTSNIHSIPGKQKNLALVLILLFTFLAYIPVLNAGFVNWDDPDYVTNNPLLNDLSNLKALFTIPIQGNYHPLTVFSLILNYKISGFEPWSYHLLNLLLHLTNCILVFRLALLLGRNNLIIAITTSLLFGIHPMHVESVAWVSERKDVLYSLFFLAGLISYTKYIDSGSKRQYGVTILFLLLSLLSKPAAVIFPIVLFAIDVLRRRKINFSLVMEKMPFLALAVIMAILTFTAQKEKGAIEGVQIFDLSTRFFMGFYGIMMYFFKLIFPVKLSPLYPYAPINESLPVVYYLSPLFFILLVVFIFYSLKRDRTVAFGILFYLINLLLILQFIPVGSAIIADRYTYIPYIGIFYIVGWLIDRYSRNELTRSYYINIPLALLLAALTFKQSMIWSDSAALWDHAIKNTPSARAYISRGDLYKKEKQYELAIQSYSEAVKINIVDQEAYTNRGNVYFEQNNYDKALADYKKAFSLDPNYVTAIDNMGAIFGLNGRYDSALFYFNLALQKNPRYIPSYRNRGLVNIELKRNENALYDFKKILEYDHNNPDIMNMVGLCYRNLGKYTEGLVIITEAIKIKPDPRFYLNRAYCYIALNNIELAKKDVLFAKQNGAQADAELEKLLQ